MPRRIQRRRTEEWRMPEGAVFVGRPSKWGNPHREGTWEELVDNYRRDLEAGELRFTREDVVRELRGKDLCCWCTLDHVCHADVLLAIANGDEHAEQEEPNE